MKRTVLSISLALCLVANSSAAIINVPADQPTIQAGIDAAGTGDTVLVAAGTYTGPGNRDIDFLGKAITVKSESGAELTIIDIQATETDRHRGFIFRSGEGNLAVLDGFTIQGGIAPWAPFAEAGTASDGGGILLLIASPTIINNIIRDNHATGSNGKGGGIKAHFSHPILGNNVIEDNSATLFGGGVLCAGSNAILRGNTIRGNSSVYGGGIECWQGGSPVITENIINGNNAVSGGAIRTDGVAALIQDNVIEGNDGGGTGGGIYFAGVPPFISRNQFIDNTASSGGAIAGRGDAPIEDNLFRGNTASNGGAISTLNASPEVSGNEFRNNIATFRGGQLRCREAARCYREIRLSGINLLMQPAAVAEYSAKITPLC